ncbi:MAG: tRNA (guanine37-N1)-methyltransferase [Candidatus Berkelbacteria bacterium Gr01-1014_85]|uniref:tRNA (guanine-N(1)-)-methyltransferase n=1 Tax=Candidatus Berkelbacteria bacterium Gr01-1014_85 TaxID=2017150 RepID=A0A554JB55_9BACT|nr:MAG: tRNA (guanine37-N1)-methyltransferase [Candidatus Berkelbacteria bacterium Gr01-1014_85]
MRIDILTLFPEMFIGPFSESILARAQAQNLVEIQIHQLRDFATDKHGTVDDTPYGGGPGMVLKIDILARAIRSIAELSTKPPLVVLLTPTGIRLTQSVLRDRLLNQQRLLLICGHYEGFDDRITQYIDLELSLGDFVLTGGEIAAMAVTDALVRLMPGVLGDDDSSQHDSFNINNLLDHPSYTRPLEFEGQRVPDILLSGNHAAIAAWRLEQAIRRTRQTRPDLLSD